LARERAVFDAHADSLQRALDLDHDLGERGAGQLDLWRGQAAGLGALVFVAWVDPKYVEAEMHGASARAKALLGAFQTLAERRPDRLRAVRAAQDLALARDARVVAGIPGIEGGHAIEESLERLEEFFELGVRVLTLVWNNHLSWIRSCQDGAGAGVPAGLSEFGRRVVQRMNERGMVVDLSHAGKRSFLDALDASSKPVIASHSGCATLHGHPRNLDEEQLRALAKNGGVVGIAFCTAFLDEGARAAERTLRQQPAYQAIGGKNDTERSLLQGEFMQRELPGLTAERVVDHIAHAVYTAGIDHVGLGSDYDGIERVPLGLEDANYALIAELMERRGFYEAEIRKVLGENLQRVFTQALPH
jgi:membrane dipeptidase